MAGGGKVRIADRDDTGHLARVVNGRLLVSGTGGGVGTDVNIDQVGGNPVGTTVPVSDGGGSLTVDGSVTIQEPLSVDDNGGSLTVDGTVDVGNFPASQTVDDGGGSLTVDGAVNVGNFPASQTVDDGGGSLTVDGAVNVGNFPASQTVDDGGGSLTVDGAVNVGNFPASQTVDDGGGSLTVDGSVTIQEPLSVDDNGGSLTVDDGGLSISVDDSGGSLTVDGTVSVSNGFTSTQLNQSAVGEPIAVTSTVPVNVHNPAGAELITIFASNLTTADATIIVNFGGAAAPANDLYFFVPSEETVPLVIQAYLDNGSIDIRRASGAGQINIFGRVDAL